MNKNKEKHHLPDEAKKGAEEPDQSADAKAAVPEPSPAQEAKPDAKPAEAGSAMDFGELSRTAEHGVSKLQKAAQEIDHLKDQLLRLRADFDNYRKRALREKGEIYENANEALTLELLPIIDHLQLALHSAAEHKADAAFREGLQLIADQFMTVLSKYGLEPFVADKKQFDPKLHEAISYLPSETEPEGTIMAQSRQGYRFKNKMLRPAQVVVSSGPKKPEQSEANNQLLEE